MASVIRPLVVYLGLLVLVRLTGKRSLGEVTTFDFLLLLLIGETLQAALLANDLSLTGAGIAVTTLLVADLTLSLAKRRWPRLDRLVEDEPVVLYQDGQLVQERMRRERVDLKDIMEAARRLHGLERLDQIKSAVLERRGNISIIPAS